MAWLILLASALCEAVWATALGHSAGFSRPVPTAVFLVFAVVSSWGLAVAARTIPIGTAYAVWTGVGAALTVAWAHLAGDESLSPWKALCIAGIIAAAVGLKLAPVPTPTSDPTAPAPTPAAPPAAPRRDGLE